MGFHLFARHDEHGNPIDEHGYRIALDVPGSSSPDRDRGFREHPFHPTRGPRDVQFECTNTTQIAPLKDPTSTVLMHRGGPSAQGAGEIAFGTVSERVEDDTKQHNEAAAGWIEYPTKETCWAAWTGKMGTEESQQRSDGACKRNGEPVAGWIEYPTKETCWAAWTGKMGTEESQQRSDGACKRNGEPVAGWIEYPTAETCWAAWTEKMRGLDIYIQKQKEGRRIDYSQQLAAWAKRGWTDHSKQSKRRQGGRKRWVFFSYRRRKTR